MNHVQILENRRDWIAYLMRPDTKKATSFLVSPDDPEARCCLGHACHVLDTPFDAGNQSYLGQTYYPPEEVMNKLGLWNHQGGGEKWSEDQSIDNPTLGNGEHSLAIWNDAARDVPQAEIGAYLETVILGGPDTPFKPIEVAA